MPAKKAAAKKPAAKKPAGIKAGKAKKTDSLEVFLADVDKELLTDWLLKAAKDSADVKRRLELFAAQHSSPAEAAKSYRALLKNLGKSRNRNPVKRAREITANFQQLYAALRGDFQRGKLEVVVEILPDALRALDLVRELDSDPRQQFAGLQQQLEDLHFEAAAELRPRPGRLAEQIHESQKSGSMVFEDAAYRYRDILGDIGLAHYRHLLEPEWQSQLQRLGGGKARSFDPGLDLLREQMLSWARALEPRQSSLREQALVLEKLAAGVEDYRDGIELYRRAGDPHSALQVAELGVNALIGRKTPLSGFAEIAKLCVQLLQETQRLEEAQAMAWRAFQALPSASSFLQLLTAAHPKEALAAWREKAHALALARSNDLLLELLLAEERVEEAQKLANGRGVTPNGWAFLARHLGKQAPQEAIPLLVSLAGQIAFGGAARHLETRNLTWTEEDRVLALLKEAAGLAKSPQLEALFAVELGAFRQALPKWSSLRRHLTF